MENTSSVCRAKVLRSVDGTYWGGSSYGSIEIALKFGDGSDDKINEAIDSAARVRPCEVVNVFGVFQ